MIVFYLAVAFIFGWAIGFIHGFNLMKKKHLRHLGAIKESNRIPR